MMIKDRQYLEEELPDGRVRLRMKPDGYHVDVDRERVRRWNCGGEYVQDVFPDLDADQREFLVSGSDPEEFERIFGDTEDTET